MYQRILVALDDSPAAQHALTQAIALAQLAGASLCVMHASDESHLRQHGMGLGSYIDVERVRAELRLAVQQLLDAAVQQASAAGVAVEQKLSESTHQRPAELIVAAAAEWQADLIVAGRHGRNAIEHLLVGSVAERLVRLAPCSVWLVRGH